MNDVELVVMLQEVAAKESGLKDSGELLKHNRELYVCKARDTAIYLAREGTGLSWERLAAMFGARHHTSLIAAHRRVKIRLERNVRHDARFTQAQWHAHVLQVVQLKGEKENA